MKKANVYLLRHGKIIDILKDISYLETMGICFKHSLPIVKLGSKTCIDVSKSDFRCGKCLREEEHEHEYTEPDYLKQDVELIKQVINLPKQIIQTCLVKNKGDLVKTVEQLQARDYQRPKEPIRKSVRIANRK
jgi:NACalpha-BTF3-like transcription factor